MSTTVSPKMGRRGRRLSTMTESVTHVSCFESGVHMKFKTAFVVVATTATAVVAGAAADDYTVRHTATDQALAHRVVLQPKEMKAPWKGSFAPSASGADEAACSGSGSLSGVVVTGEARSKFTFEHSVIVGSDSTVFESAKMVAIDWHRSETVFRDPTECLRKTWASSGPKGSRLVKVERLALPTGHRIRLRAYRATIELAAQGGGVPRILMDLVFFSRGRVEGSLTVGGGFRDARDAIALRALDIRLASLMAARMP
jgi:hypothetical protein